MAQDTNAKILVIDDEVALLQNIVVYLQDSGFIVKSAANGKEGLEIFDEYQPDLVLTDIHMPALSGLEVLHAIVKKSPDTPVIVISGAGEINDAISALRFGAWDYITKPIANLQVLEHAFKKALQTKKLQQENAQYAQRIAHNLKMLEEDQAAGRKVQLTLLPAEKMQINNIAFNFKIFPSLELSGDFVEYFKISDHLTGVYIADVSGHGASSAFITILLKSIIAKYQVHYTAGKDDIIAYPEQLMSAVSQDIFISKLGKYLTLIYGVINTSTSEFTYVVAGHYPGIILYTAAGVTKFLDGEGFPIGIMANAAYESQTIKLHSGDHLVMLSDGVMEVFMPGKNLSQKEEGLLLAVQTSKGDLAAILKGCDINNSKTDIQQPDDITILVISYL